MSIGGIQGGSYGLQHIGHAGRRGASAMSDGDGDGSASGSGGFSNALSQSLSQIGVSGSNASTQGSQQAMSAFVQSLMAALQAQGVQGSNSMGSASAISGQGGIEGRLQGLIQQLSSPTSKSNSTDIALQQNFQNLLSAQGASGSQASLSSFLQTLSQNLQGTNSVGGMINTHG